MKIAGYDLRAYLVYRRTISRPNYDQLNPFNRYVDEFLTETGNPSLRPQFNQNYEANVSVDERPILAIGINDTKDIFTNVVYQSDTSQSQAYRTYDNLGKTKNGTSVASVLFLREAGISLYWVHSIIIIFTRDYTKTNHCLSKRNLDFLYLPDI